MKVIRIDEENHGFIGVASSMKAAWQFIVNKGWLGFWDSVYVFDEWVGIDELFDTVIDVYERRNKSVRHVHVNHGPVIEAAVNDIKERLRSSQTALKYSPRYLALKMLEEHDHAEILSRIRLL